MPAIASGSDLLAPVTRDRVATRSAGGAPARKDSGPPPAAVASLLAEARASARAEAEVEEPAAGGARLAARAADQTPTGLAVDDPRFPVFPPAFPVQSLIVALDRGIAAYRATQALDVRAGPKLALAAADRPRIPTTV